MDIIPKPLGAYPAKEYPVNLSVTPKAQQKYIASFFSNRAMPFDGWVRKDVGGGWCCYSKLYRGSETISFPYDDIFSPQVCEDV